MAATKVLKMHCCVEIALSFLSTKLLLTAHLI